jgi:drug/metabolite transporter (DMT)-like permease
MTWFFLALVAPFLYALTNHIDKVLISRYFKESGVGALILFSSLLSFIAMPFLFWADPTVFSLEPISIAVLAIGGILNILVLWCYFIALSDDEASVTVIFYQLVPVFALILAYFVLGETITKMQFIAMAIIIIGTSIISFDIDADNKFRIRTQTVFLMSAASFFWALESVLFKMIALEENWIRSLFWEHLMLLIVGGLVFVFIKKYREDFLQAVRENSKPILALNIGNESLYMLGNIIFAYTYMLAPVALVLLTQSFQPLFVIIVGVFLTIFFPKITVEKVTLKDLTQKFLAIIITGIGTYLLFI